MILKTLKGNPFGNTDDEKALYEAFEEGKTDQRAADQIEVEKLAANYQLVVAAFVDHVKKLEAEVRRLKGTKACENDK